MSSVTLDFDQRNKVRQRLTLDDGTEAALMLERGQRLQPDDRLTDDHEHEAVRVIAACERVSTVYCDDRHRLNRICYHLGNRHVPLAVGIRSVTYRHDHVLDDMIRGLGVEPVVEDAPFMPEPGAYEAGHDHSHE